MNPNEGAVVRHRDRRAPIHQLKEPPAERRWRRSLAAIAVSALAIGGVSTLAAAPAVADEALPVTVTDAATATAEGEAASAEALEPEAVAPDAAEPEPAPAPPPADVPVPVEDPAPAVEPTGDPAASPLGAEAALARSAPDDTSADAAGAASDAVALLVPPPPDEVVDKVEICHGTASHNNPYVINEPAADGNVSGHADHVGPIWFPGIEGVWGDIIPPFSYDDGDETPGFFPGLNWDATGQLVFANDCAIPEEPDIDITVTDCILYSGFGLLEVSLGGLLANFDYRVTVSGAGGVLDSVVIPGSEGAWSESWELPPGDYTVTVEWSADESPWFLLESLSFTINACPELGVTVTVLECSTGGGATGTGTTVVLFTGLIPGERYSFVVFEGPGDFRDAGEFVASGSSREFSADLPPGDFVASIEWIPGPEVELDPVVASTTFTVVPCPPVVPEKPVTPAKVVPVKALPKTGTSGIGELLLGSMLLLGFGGAALIAARRRRPGDQHLG